MKKRVSISIGEYYSSKDPAVIYTLLGSCVAACLFDRKRGIGGMNHILLPGRANPDNPNDATRFGVNAMEMLINSLMELGADRTRLSAKIFGGANVIPGISSETAVGPRISEFVIEFLNREKINIISWDLGGIYSRKIYFHTDTADVFLKRNHSIKSSLAAAEKERIKLMKLREKEKKPMDITFF